jgi:probable O-glycosylation ligase (exosortase A-associated)
VSTPTPTAEWWGRGQSSPAVASMAATGRAERIAFGGLALLTLIVIVAPQRLFPPLATARPALLAALVAIGAALVRRAGARLPMLVINRGVLLACALLGWAVLTVPFSLWPGGSVETITDTYAKVVAVFWLIGATVDSRERLRQFIAWISILSVVPALATLRHYASGSFAHDRVVTYEAALTGNPNDLAMFLVIVMPLTLALAVTAATARSRAGFSLIVVAQVTAAVLTFSRGGFLALAAVVVVVFVKSVASRRGASALAVVVLVLAGAWLVPGRYVDHLGTIADISADQTGSAQERWDELKLAARLMLASPVLGTGIGTDVLALNAARGPRWINVHNVYLRHGVELGVPGLALFVALMAVSFVAARGVQRPGPSGPDRELGRLGEGVETSLIAFAVAGFFSPLAYHLPFYVVGGLAMAAETVHGSESRAPSPMPTAAAAAEEVEWWRHR